MSYIKKLVMQGFKSFPRKTELPFTTGINVVLGPNGAGKSNITDALCFVLGRLSMKSMRATKASNLIFLGTKDIGPAKEASVEIIFDNKEKTFSLEEKEISIKRILRKNGQSIYKINSKTKTRQEILALLAQAGIDPNGFNIILQGEIQNFVMMQGEERRKIIEEVAGISIYESRKEKSLRELEKTENKLKEVATILRERTSLLNNLEKEREAALRHQRLEKDVKKCKKSLIHLRLVEKKRDKEIIDKQINDKNKEIEKIKGIIIEYKTTIENLEIKISEINNIIQKQTGFEQEKLNQDIANLRADIAGLTVRFENHEDKLKEIFKQKENLKNLVNENEKVIQSLQKESPTIEKTQKELKRKEQALEDLEKERKKYYMVKTELRTIKDRLEDKKDLLQNYENESKFLLKQIDAFLIELFDKRTTSEKVEKLKLSLAQKKELILNLNRREREIEKKIHMDEAKIEEQKKVIRKIADLDVCPLCKNRITHEHINDINNEIKPEILELKREINEGEKELNEIYKKINFLNQDIESLTSELQKRQSDLVKLMTIQDKNEQIKVLQNKIDISNGEFNDLIKRKDFLEENFEENSNVEERYETLKMEVQEISLRNKENLNAEISFKQRELERMIISIKQFSREEEDLNEEIISIQKNLSEKEKLLDSKRKDEEILTSKAQKHISERERLQKEIRENENELSKKNNLVYNLEQIINNYKVDLARINAEIENKETEILEFSEVELIKANKETLTNRLRKTEEMLYKIGSVNMRALEAYDAIKVEYDSIQEKVDIISKEKEEILKIVHQIDIKKKKAFLITLNSLNEIFSRNFSQISIKGQVSLEIENKKQPFENGINIVVKTGHGKYFDVKSLSGGEQTMVALSLIFAIQELKPYYFYILDEIDAALDKKNSERLAKLLRKYMVKGQYIVISHNDEVITGATNLFGVSMQEGISKVISLKV